MDKTKIRTILEKIETKKITVREGLDLLKNLPYQDIGIAKIDTHRELRRNLPEAIFGKGKTNEQILQIAKAMNTTISPILITKTTKETYDYLKSDFSNSEYFSEAHLIRIGKSKSFLSQRKVSVVCAGTSDIPIAEESVLTLETYGYRAKRYYDVGIAGLHRMLDVYQEIDKSDIVIVVAGMEGALPSVLSGLITKPIIAVPTSIGYGANFNGLSALLSMLNSCSPGITVVNIDNGFGAAYFTISLLLSVQ